MRPCCRLSSEPPAHEPARVVYLTGTQNADGSCSLATASGSGFTGTVTLECGASTNNPTAPGSWTPFVSSGGVQNIQFELQGTTLSCEKT